MKFLDNIKARKELKERVDAAIEASHKAQAEAFARSLNLPNLKVNSEVNLGIGILNAKFDTGFRLENVLRGSTHVKRHRLYRYLKASQRKDAE